MLSGPRVSRPLYSSAASDVYKRQGKVCAIEALCFRAMRTNMWGLYVTNSSVEVPKDYKLSVWIGSGVEYFVDELVELDSVMVIV